MNFQRSSVYPRSSAQSGCPQKIVLIHQRYVYINLCIICSVRWHFFVAVNRRKVLLKEQKQMEMYNVMCMIENSLIHNSFNEFYNKETQQYYLIV